MLSLKNRTQQRKCVNFKQILGTIFNKLLERAVALSSEWQEGMIRKELASEVELAHIKKGSTSHIEKTPTGLINVTFCFTMITLL